LGSKQGGLFVLSPFLSGDNSLWFRGTADSIYQNLSFLRRSNEPYVIISSGDCVYKMDYNDIIDFHIEKGADITVLCKDMKGMDVVNFGVVKMDEEGTVELLMQLLKEVIPDGRYDFVRDVVVRYRKQQKIYGYMYDNFWASINSTKSYYDLNMKFLDRDIRQYLFFQEPYIETKRKDEPPAKYNAESSVKNCLIGSGSIICGTLENSVLFRRVHVKEKSIIRNSIIMEGCEISENCYIEYAVLDKDVKVNANQTIRGTHDKPRIIEKESEI
jgi:glucose-1-phosphate adenylyltransferase